MQHRNGNGGPALLQLPAALRPQLVGGQRGIDRNDAGADGHAQRGILRQQRGDGGNPGQPAQQDSGPVRLAAVKNPRRVPDHAAGDEADGVERERKRLAEQPASVQSDTEAAPRI